jgi:hypothetical protein
MPTPGSSPDSRDLSGSARVRWTAALVAIALLAVAVRTAVSIPRDWVGYDEANYLMIARNASEGAGYRQSPLTEFAPKFHLLGFLAPQLLTHALQDELLASKAIFVTLGGLSALLAAALGGALFGGRVGVASGVLFAVAAPLTTLISHSITHSLFLPLFLGGLLSLWFSSSTGRASYALLAGLLIGLSWWARADGLLVAPVGALFLASAFLLLGHPRVALVRALLAFVTFFGVAYVAHNLITQRISDGTPEAHGPLYDFLLYPIACEPNQPLASYDSFFRLILSEPTCVLRRMATTAESVPEVLFAWSGFPLLLLPLIGIAWISNGRASKELFLAHLLLFLGCLPLLGYLPFYYNETRYVAPYSAIAFVWCALGALVLGDRAAFSIRLQGGPHRPLQRWLHGSFRVAPLAGVALFLLAITVLHGARVQQQGGREYVEMGQWIRLNTAADAVLWTTQAEIAYFAHRPWKYPPDPDELPSAEVPAGAPLLLAVDTRYFLVKKPLWRKLVAKLDSLDQVLAGDDSSEPPSFARALFSTGNGIERISLYRLHLDALPRTAGPDAP